MPEIASKLSGVQYVLKEKLQRSPNQYRFIGDDKNDHCALQESRRGFVLSSGHPDTVKWANESYKQHVTVSNFPYSKGTNNILLRILETSNVCR